MSHIRLARRNETENPLDLVEGIVAHKDWHFDRRTSREMAVEVPGRWCDYSLYFAWSDDIAAMHFSCAMDMRVPSTKRREVAELVALINERLWLGHFGLWNDEGLPLFRHTTLLRGAPGASVGQMEDLVDIAVAECERFYPAFQYVIWGGKSAEDAIAASLIDTVGQA